jgi:site-specific DNA-methyltransferase (adenine-specific)
MAKELIGSLELNRIYQMDCIEGMRLIPDKSIDMILCDLPYGTTRNKWDSIIPLELLWEQYERIIKDNGAIVLTAQPPFDKILGASNINLLKYEWIWDKEVGTGFLNAKKMPLKRTENILVFYKKLPIYNPIMTEAKPENIRPVNKGNGVLKSTNYNKVLNLKNSDDYNPAKRYPTNLIKISKSSKECNSLNRLHPTQKPVSLFEYLIKTYTNEGETVIDNCMGSGTTAVAALRTNRKFIGFELESEYVRIANQRIENVTDEIAEMKLTESEAE